jgi:hypothetical protein
MVFSYVGILVSQVSCIRVRFSPLKTVIPNPQVGLSKRNDLQALACIYKVLTNPRKLKHNIPQNLVLPVAVA